MRRGTWLVNMGSGGYVADSKIGSVPHYPAAEPALGRLRESAGRPPPKGGTRYPTASKTALAARSGFGPGEPPRAGLFPLSALRVAVTWVEESSRRTTECRARTKRSAPPTTAWAICSPVAHHNGPALPGESQLRRCVGKPPEPIASTGGQGTLPGTALHATSKGLADQSLASAHPFAQVPPGPTHAPPEKKLGITPQVDRILHGRCPPTFSGSQNGVRPTGRYP